jgi:SAM-dependent methyltransferase
MKRTRFGQGHSVRRDLPHVFHRDYWILRRILEGVAAFIGRHGETLRGKTIVDFGASECPYKQMFAARGINVIAADLTEVREEGLLRISPEGRVPLEDGAVDGVLSTQVLEHVPDVQGYLREAYRLLKPGGLLFVTTHGAFVLHRVPTDMRRWTVDGLRWEIERAGFAVDFVRPRIGILAMATHLRAIAWGGMTRKVPVVGGVLRPIIYLLGNLRMGLEDLITPASAMESHPELLVVEARKPGG